MSLMDHNLFLIVFTEKKSVDFVLLLGFFIVLFCPQYLMYSVSKLNLLV